MKDAIEKFTNGPPVGISSFQSIERYVEVVQI